MEMNGTANSYNDIADVVANLEIIKFLGVTESCGGRSS